MKEKKKRKEKFKELLRKVCYSEKGVKKISKKYKFGSKHDPFSPKFDHSKCYFWCGNPYCHSRPKLDDNED